MEILDGVPSVREEAFAVVEVHERLRGSRARRTALHNRGAEDPGPGRQQGGQMVEDNDFLSHHAGKAVQEVAKSNRPEGPKGREWGEGVRQHFLRCKPADAPGRGCEAVRIEIEQRN